MVTTDLEFGLHIVQSVNISILLSVWQALLSSYEEVCKAPVPYQALELALMRICYLADLPLLETLMSALKTKKIKEFVSMLFLLLYQTHYINYQHLPLQ